MNFSDLGAHPWGTGAAIRLFAALSLTAGLDPAQLPLCSSCLTGPKGKIYLTASATIKAVKHFVPLYTRSTVRVKMNTYRKRKVHLERTDSITMLYLQCLKQHSRHLKQIFTFIKISSLFGLNAHWLFIREPMTQAASIDQNESNYFNFKKSPNERKATRH